MESQILNDIVIENIQSQSDQLADLEKQALANDGNRKEGLKSHLHKIIIFGMYVSAVLVGFLTVIRFWHFAAPQEYYWLDKDHLHDIERIIFSSVIVTAISFYIKSVFRTK